MSPLGQGIYLLGALLLLRAWGTLVQGFCVPGDEKWEVQRGQGFGEGHPAPRQDARRRGKPQGLTCLPAPVPFLLQRLKYLLTPREPNRWAVEREGAMPYSSRMALNNALRKPTHIVVETMM